VVPSDHKLINYLLMKRLNGLTIILSVAILTGSCLSQKKLVQPATAISPLTDTTVIRGGSLVYSLPQTSFTISVEMERIIQKPGPYWKYANDLLGFPDIITSDREIWSITGITVKSHQEVDPSGYYVIESNTLFHTNVLTLRKEGLIMDLNPLIYNDEGSLITNKQMNTGLPGIYDLGSDEYFQIQRDTAYKRVSIDSSFVRIPYLVEKKKKLTIDQLAEKAAKRLMELRDGKFLILTGEATVYPQNEAALIEISRIEKEYTELFTGKSWKENKTFSFQLTPKKEMIGKPLTLFRFSSQNGPLSVSEKNGIPVMVELIPEQKTKEIAIIKKQQTQSSESKFDKLYYRIPDVVNLKISRGPETLFNSRRLIYQFGEVMQLPANYIIGK
jgi:hypothetical protein